MLLPLLDALVGFTALPEPSGHLCGQHDGLKSDLSQEMRNHDLKNRCKLCSVFLCLFSENN